MDLSMGGEPIAAGLTWFFDTFFTGRRQDHVFEVDHCAGRTLESEPHSHPCLPP